MMTFSMHHNWLFRLSICLVLSSFMVSCSQYKDTSLVRPVDSLYWPIESQQPRVQYLGYFTGAADLGISKGIWTRLLELFTGAEESYMVRPMAVTVDRDGVIYVADPGARGVHCFDRQGQSYRFIRLRENRTLLSPVGLLLDPEGNLYISDSKLAAIYRVSKGEKFADKFVTDVTFLQPTGMVAGANDYFYVVDTLAQKIIQLDFSGRLISEFGRRGSDDGEFNYPTMLALMGRDLLVTDSLNFRIQRFDQQGHYVASFGRLGDATGYHSRPKGIATDKDQNIYVVDTLFHTVQVFDAEGQFLMNFGEHGQKPGQFWLPTGLFIDHDQTIYVADSHNQRVQMFRYLGVKP